MPLGGGASRGGTNSAAVSTVFLGHGNEDDLLILHSLSLSIAFFYCLFLSVLVDHIKFIHVNYPDPLPALSSAALIPQAALSLLEHTP